MHNSPTKKRNEKKALLLLPNKGLMGTDNPSSPFAAACTINVKTTPISENSPSPPVCSSKSTDNQTRTMYIV
jgi:hypothetical protein